MDCDSKRILEEELKVTFSFVEELSAKQLRSLVHHSTLQEIPAETVIAEKFSDCPGLVLVLSGELRVSKISEDGREVTLYRIGKGSLCPFSAACILGSFKGDSVKVKAETDMSIIRVHRNFFVKSFSECEPFWRFVIGSMSNRLFEAADIVDSIAFISIKKRLAQLLLLESSYGKYPINKTHEALARELGTVREVISRELKGFERRGILRLARGRLIVNNTDDLERIAQN